MKKTINWGVLGAASIATKRCMPGINEAPSATLLALASRDIEKARSFAQTLKIPRVYGGYDELLGDSDVDAVYIPLPNALHFDWSVRALEAGKHVLCEKPLCLSSAQVRQLCAVRDLSGKHIEEAFAFRNHPQWTKVDEIMTRGRLGPVRAAHGMLAKQFFDPADIRNNPAGGGGGMYDLGSYAICACNLIFKRAPLRVVAALDIDPAFAIDRLSSALLDYGDAHASFTVATQSGGDGWGSQQHLTVLFARGWLRFSFPYSQVQPTPCTIEIGESSSVGASPTHTLSFDPANQFALQAERFSRRLLGDPVATWPIEESLATLRTIEALFESARGSCWQALEES